MSIFYLKAENVSRSKGRSAVAAAAYQAGRKLCNELDGTSHDFRSKSPEILYHAVLLPPQAPHQDEDPQKLWNKIEKCCAKKNSRARSAKSFIIGLSRELSLADSVFALKQFVDGFVGAGYAVQINIHHPEDKKGNPHAHVLIAARPYAADGSINMTALQKKEAVYLRDAGGNLVPELGPDGAPKLDRNGKQKFLKKPLLDADGKQKFAIRKGKGRTALYCSRNVSSNPLDGRDALKAWKEKWTEICNELLENLHAIKIDANLYNRIDRNGLAFQPLPHKHLGPEVFALLKKGILVGASEDEQEIRQLNALCFRQMQIESQDWYNPDWSPPLHAYEPRYLLKNAKALAEKRLACLAKLPENEYLFYSKNDSINEALMPQYAPKYAYRNLARIREDDLLKLVLGRKDDWLTGRQLAGILERLGNEAEQQIRRNSSYISTYNKIYADKKSRSFLAMNYVSRGRLKTLRKAREKLNANICKKKRLAGENRLVGIEGRRLELHIIALQEQVKILETEILRMQHAPSAKERYEYFTQRLKKSATRAREKALQKLDENNSLRAFKTDVQLVKNMLTSDDKHIPSAEIARLGKELEITNLEASITKIGLIKKVIQKSPAAKPPTKTNTDEKINKHQLKNNRNKGYER